MPEQTTRRLKDAGDRTLLSLMASQIANFVATVRLVTLSGLNITSGTLTAADTILSAFGKLIWKVTNLTKNDVGLENVANLTPADLPVSSAAQTALAAKADLVGGKVPTAQIPAIALTEFLGTVASQVAMLSLVGQRGDWCIRSDQSKSYILTADNSAILENWQAIAYPASSSSVNSINGQTGTVVLGKADIGLSNVPNTDATNPANITENSIHRFATDAEKAAWNAKQAALGYTPVRSAANSPQEILAICVGTTAELPALNLRAAKTLYVEIED